MAFSPTPPFGEFEIDITTGMMDIDGKQVNYREYFDLLDDAIEDHVEGLKHLRDPQSAIQNLWGRKDPDGDGQFYDEWYGRARPIVRPTGYANDFKVDDWENQV